MRIFMKRSAIFMSSAGLLSFVLSASPVTLDVDNGISLEPSLAFAKGGKGKGNGKGNGREGTNGPGASSFAKDKVNNGKGGRGRGPVSARSADGASVGGNAFGRLNANNLGNGHRSVAATLGRLNAAHASPNARLHASANSTVGLLATYENAVKDGRVLTAQAETLNAEIAALQEELAALDMAALEQSAAETAENAELAAEAYASAQSEADALAESAEAARAAADNDPTDPALALEADQAEAAAAEAAANAEALGTDAEGAQQTADAAQAELDGAADKIAATEEALASAQSEADGIDAAIEEAALVEAESLAAAANKPITDEVVAAVNTLLGLDEFDVATAALDPENDGAGGDLGLEEIDDFEGFEDGDEWSEDEGDETGKNPNAGLGNGGEDGDPGQSGWHNAVSDLERGVAAGELDDSRELDQTP